MSIEPIFPISLTAHVLNLTVTGANFRAQRDLHKTFSPEWELNESRRQLTADAIEKLNLLIKLES